jgi:ATP-dependent exoDNAse (exonuclease V) beta subunit
MNPEREDALARDAALDITRSVIVQAPAGAGKTELLTRRVLRLLPTVDAPEAIVAITFTRKAAAEMRARILGQIARAADPTPPASEHERATWHLARSARDHAEKRGWQLDEAPQRLRILTIDALCAALVRQSPMLSETGGSLRVTEDARVLHAAAAGAVLSHLEGDGPEADAVAAALGHFDNRPDVLQNQIAALLAGRERWRHLLDVASDADARRVMEDALAALVGDWLAQLRDALGALDRAALLDLARFAANHVAPDHPAHVLAALDDLEPTAEALPAWRALAEFCLTREGDFRAAPNRNQGFPPGPAFAASKQAMIELLGKLRERPGLAERLHGVRGLPEPRYGEAQWQALADLLAVLRLAMAELKLEFAARGELDFTEIALSALTALGDSEHPSELLLRLDHQIRHLLVDEFQDTSNLQVELLRRLTAGWSPGDGRSLFLVGDPMQSIYRFRHANVGLFLSVRRDGLGGLPLDALGLRLNFRSQQGIVDWVNRVFGRLLPGHDDIEGGQAAYAEAVASHPALEGPAVHWHAQIGHDPQAEAKALAARAAELAGRGESVAVLVRSRGHLAAIVPALREAGVPYLAVDIEGLAERPVIDDLRALTLALGHPGDRLHWLAVLRAPWCGLALADLAALCEGLRRDAPLLERLRTFAAGAGPGLAMGGASAPTRSSDAHAGATCECADAEEGLAPAYLSLASDARVRLERALAALLPALDRRGRIPLRRLVEDTWLALGGPACLREARDLHDAQRFFEALDRLAPESLLTDPARLDGLLAELKAAPDPEGVGGVQLMTIHKAKGLEFDHVLLPGLGRVPRRSDSPAIVHSPTIDARDREIPLLAAQPPRGGGDDPIHAFLCSTVESARDDAETDRLLYVAATRARKHLYLFGHVEEGKEGPAPRARSLLARLWPAVREAFLAAAAPAPDRDQTVQAAPRGLLRRLPLDWRPPAADCGLTAPAPGPEASAAPPPFAWAGEAARFTGTLYHRWVQLFGEHPERVPDEDGVERLKPTLRAEAERAGLPAHEVERIVENVAEALAATLADARGRWLLKHRPGQSWSEYALTTLGADGRLQRHVIDRSFIDEDGTRWIIDFKTGRHEGGDLAGFIAAERERYAEQLRRYRGLFSDQAHPIRLALYYPLLPEAERFIEIDA